MKAFFALVAGLAFGFGLLASGMSSPVRRRKSQIQRFNLKGPGQRLVSIYSVIYNTCSSRRHLADPPGRLSARLNLLPGDALWHN